MLKRLVIVCAGLAAIIFLLFWFSEKPSEFKKEDIYGYWSSEPPYSSTGFGERYVFNDDETFERMGLTDGEHAEKLLGKWTIDDYKLILTVTHKELFAMDYETGVVIPVEIVDVEPFQTVALTLGNVEEEDADPLSPMILIDNVEYWGIQ